MEQENSVILPQQPAPKKNIKNLLFIEIGLFEIGFVVIILGLIFGILNYFNILSLSRVFPALSFLPQVNKVKVKTPTTVANPLANSLAIPDQNLEKFTMSQIQNVYLPRNGLTQINTTDTNITTYNWIVGNNSFTAQQQISSTSANILYQSLSLTAKNFTTAITSTKSATQLFNMYFYPLNPKYFTFQCNLSNANTIYICKARNIIKSIQQTYKITILPTMHQALIYSCSMPILINDPKQRIYDYCGTY